MSNNSYFGGIAAGLKTLAIGMKTTMKEYFTPKSTEQYPENRKTTLHISPRFRGRLVFVRLFFLFSYPLKKTHSISFSASSKNSSSNCCSEFKNSS